MLVPSGRFKWWMEVGWLGNKQSKRSLRSVLSFLAEYRGKAQWAIGGRVQVASVYFADD